MTRSIIGPRTKKALEEISGSFIMDARQTRRYLRTLSEYSGREYELIFLAQAPRPSPGPHKLRESLPLTVFLRYRLKYALTGREVVSIVNQRLVKVDGKVRTDATYPAGFMGTALWILDPQISEYR